MRLLRSLFSTTNRLAEVRSVEEVNNGPVLVVEDDVVFARTLRDYLESQFYDVTVAHDGTEGVRKVMAQPFEMIICDMMMPKLPGDMFYRAVERINENLCPRFIFITGHGGVCKVTEFIRSVKGHSLIKPFHLTDLLELMRLIERTTPSPIRADLRASGSKRAKSALPARR